MAVINKSPFSVLCVLLYFLASLVISTQCERYSTTSFSIDPLDLSAQESLSYSSRRKRDVAETSEERSDSRCEKQKENFAELTKKLKDGKRLEETHEFSNETKFNLALAWAGENDNGNLIVLTTESSLLGHSASTLWRSENHGRQWKNISNLVKNEIFRKSDGLQRNPHTPAKVYLIGYDHFIYLTEDGGDHWKREDLVQDKELQKKFSIDEVLEFHSMKKYQDYVAIISHDRTLYVTYDNFQSPMLPKRRYIHSVKWGTHEKYEKSLYVAVGEYKNPYSASTPQELTLARMDHDSGAWKTLLTNVVTYDVQGKFLYASKYKSSHPVSTSDDRLMMISTDGGDSWKEARLPTLTKDRFYRVLDMSEDLIFMHVDNPGDTGHGTLYTSSSDGVVFSESLTHHLYPNFNTVHDFYKVKSLRGVYLSSQMGDEQSIHTVITYDMGGEWKSVARPKDANCENSEAEGCFLQIHNAYSIHRGIKARLPHSIDKAAGLLMVHAHVAKNLQTSDPDVYLSNDGGYTFRKVLDGPHAYEIADSGGLLIAIPLETDTPDTIKFSTDEGHCWHNYRFTDKNLRFTGLLTEPGGLSMTVSIWGYTTDSKKWTVNTIDFKEVVTKQCHEEDYESWTPHTALHKGSEHEGCLLGQKEAVKKIKIDSWCYNGYDKLEASVKAKCLCTKEDYECDYGFHRKVGSEDCVRQGDIKAEEIEICKGTQMETLITLGYRLVPGDKCDINNPKGFHPSPSKEISFDSVCKAGDKKAVSHDLKANENTGSSMLIIVAIVVGLVLLLGAIGSFLVYKMVILRRHKVVYRYSMLNNQAGDDGRDNEFENALASSTALYNDMSDEEVEADNESPEHRNRNGHAGKGDRKQLVHGYHDDSDDDMLG